MKKKKKHNVNMDNTFISSNTPFIATDFKYITFNIGNSNLFVDNTIREINFDTYTLFNLENAFTKYTRIVNSFPKNASANDRIKFKVLLNNQKPEITKIKEQYKRYNTDQLLNLSQPEINQIEIYTAIMDKFTKHVKGYILTVESNLVKSLAIQNKKIYVNKFNKF